MRLWPSPALWLLLAGGLACQVPPEATAPGDWVVTTPAAAGLSQPAVDSVVAQVDAGQYGEIHGLLVARDGALAVEQYFRGYGRDRLHPVYSVTKSVAALLIGIAIDQGAISSVDAPLTQLLPAYAHLAAGDPLKSGILLRHVLTMTAGFEWDELSTRYGDPANPTYALASSDDWIGFMMRRPMAFPPGARYAYNSGCSILLSGILMAATGVPAEAFSARRLFGPLGITAWAWESGPRRLTNTGWGLSLFPRDMARIGELVLRHGAWEGRQIVSREWLTAATSPRTVAWNGHEYGYQWYRIPPGGDPAFSSHEVVYAAGYGGQFILVFPDVALVMAITGGNFDNYGLGLRLARDFFTRAVATSLPQPARAP